LGQVSVGAMLWLVISFPKTEKDQGKRQIWERKPRASAWGFKSRRTRAKGTEQGIMNVRRVKHIRKRYQQSVRGGPTMQREKNQKSTPHCYDKDRDMQLRRQAQCLRRERANERIWS
jgi:hypothetical protein